MELTEKGKAWKKRVSTKEYREGWDRVFGKEEKQQIPNITWISKICPAILKKMEEDLRQIKGTL
jgi:hypothetical protein